MRKLPSVKTIIMYLFLAEFLVLICMQNSEYSLLNSIIHHTYEKPVLYLNSKANKNLLGSLVNFTYAAHRGAPSLSKEPENSLPAFNGSKEFGFKIVETDLQLTKDSQWVILHDDTLDRTTNGKGNIENYYLKDVKLLKLKNTENQNLSVPTLAEFLKLCSNDELMPILDIKPNEKQITPKDYNSLLSSLDKFHLLEKSIFCSYSKKVLTELRRRDNLTAIAVMMKPQQDNLDFARELGNAFMYCNSKDLTDDDLMLIEKNDLKFAVWTVNDEKTAEGFLKKGAMLVATDILH